MREADNNTGNDKQTDYFVCNHHYIQLSIVVGREYRSGIYARLARSA